MEQANLTNWREIPHSRWPLRNISQLIRTAPIAAGPRAAGLARRQRGHARDSRQLGERERVALGATLDRPRGRRSHRVNDDAINLECVRRTRARATSKFSSAPASRSPDF
jgi:hypothetical protein